MISRLKISNVSLDNFLIWWNQGLRSMKNWSFNIRIISYNIFSSVFALFLNFFYNLNKSVMSQLLVSFILFSLYWPLCFHSHIRKSFSQASRFLAVQVQSKMSLTIDMANLIFIFSFCFISNHHWLSNLTQPFNMRSSLWLRKSLFLRINTSYKIKISRILIFFIALISFVNSLPKLA